MSALYTVVMDSILPEIIKSYLLVACVHGKKLGEKLADKLYKDMDEFYSEGELNTQLVKNFTTCENPTSDYSGISWKSTDPCSGTSSSITEAIFCLGGVIEYCSVWPKYIDGDMHTNVPVSLMKDVCKAFLRMKNESDSSPISLVAPPNTPDISFGVIQTLTGGDSLEARSPSNTTTPLDTPSSSNEAIEFIMGNIIYTNFGHLNSEYIDKEKIRRDLLPLVTRFVRCESESDSRSEIAHDILFQVMVDDTKNVDDEANQLMEMIPEMLHIMNTGDSTNGENLYAGYHIFEEEQSR